MDEIMLQFIDKIIEKTGLKLPDDFMKQCRGQLLSNLEKKIWLMMLDELNDEALKKFVEISGGIKDIEKIDDNKKSELIKFFRDNINDFDAKVLKVMDEFGKKFLEDVKKLKKE